MKNKKILSALIGLAAIPSVIAPLTITACSDQTSNKVTLTSDSEQTLNNTYVATYEFQLEKALESSEEVSCEVSNVVSQTGVTVEVNSQVDIDAGQTTFSVDVTIDKDGDLINGDEVTFDLVFKGKKAEKQTFISNVQGFKISYCNEYKIIPLDKLVIKEGVLHGLNCTWDDESIVDCNTLFIPNNVVEISRNYNNDALTDLGHIENHPQIKIIKFEKGSKPLYINDYVFQTIEDIEKIILPKRLSYIGHDCFKNVASLTTIDVSEWDSEKFTSNNPFGEKNIFSSNKLSETGEIILRGENSINADAYYTFTAINSKFAGWEGIVAPQATGQTEDGFIYDIYDNKKIITDVVDKTTSKLVIPAWCYAIKPNAFFDGSTTTLPNIGGITVAQGAELEKIYAGAFCGTKAIIADLLNAENLKHLDNGVFYNSSLKDIYLPDSLETISPNCFAGSKSLIAVDLSQTNVQKISFGTFNGCTSLTTIKMKPSIDWIGAYAFSECASLTTQFDFVENFKNVTYIGALAFAGCQRCEIVLSNPGDDTSVLSYLGQQAFMGSSLAGDIYIPKSVEYICDGVFSYNPNITNMLVSPNNPKYHAVEGYLYNSDNELLFACGQSGAIPTEITSIRPYAVAGMQYMGETLDLGATSIETIGESAFKDLSCIGTYPNGFDIILPQTVKKIGKEAFANTILLGDKPGLKFINLYVLDHLTELGEGCFDRCKKMTEIVLPAGLTKIGANCFRNSGVEKATIPNSVTKVENYAFQSCTMQWIDVHTYQSVPDNWATASAFLDLEGKSEKVTVYINNPDLLGLWKEQFITGGVELEKLDFVVGQP